MSAADAAMGCQPQLVEGLAGKQVRETAFARIPDLALAGPAAAVSCRGRLVALAGR
jgi:hypothetical protein